MISFVGWSGYAIWKAYDQESINLYIFGSSSTQYHDGESSIISNKLSSLPSNKSEETLETTTRQSLNDDVSPSEIDPTDNSITTMKIPESSIIQDISLRNSKNTNTEETTKDSFESSINDDDKKLKITMPSLDKSKTEEEKSSADKKEFELRLSPIWPVYSGFIPLFEYNSKEIPSSAERVLLKKLNEEYKRDDENTEVLKFQENSFKKDDLSDDQNDENNRSYEKDVPTSAEIINNLKILHESIDTMMKNMLIENHQIDDELSSIEDESSNHFVSGLGRQDSTETPSSILGKDSEITFHDRLYEQDPYDDPLENSDTSKVDDATSNLKTGSLENLDLDSWLFYHKLKRQQNSAEISLKDILMRNRYSEDPTSAIEENDDDRMKTRRLDVNPAISSSTENVNSKEEIVSTNSKTGDSNEGVTFNDRSFESSSHSTEDFKSDASMEEDVEDYVSFPNHYPSSLVEVHTTENSLNDMTSSNQNIDIKDSTIEQEPTEISINSKNFEHDDFDFSSEEWRFHPFSDEYYPYDGPVHIDPVHWWINRDKYHRRKWFSNHMLRKRRGIAKIMSGQSTL